jgi:UPF0716 protein FxsA
MGLLVSLFIVLPLLELFLLVRIGRVVGFPETVGFVLAMGVLGAMVARRQGRRVWSQWQEALASGRVPEEGIIGGVLALFGAVLIITPGLLTDVLGLALLIPVVRAPIAKLVSRYLQRQLADGTVRIYGGPAGSARKPPRETEVGRASYRPSEVIDTQGEEVER